MAEPVSMFARSAGALSAPSTTSAATAVLKALCKGVPMGGRFEATVAHASGGRLLAKPGAPTGGVPVDDQRPVGTAGHPHQVIG